MAAADSGPPSPSDHDPAPGPDTTASSHSSPTPDRSDCPTCSRRTFLKGAGTLAAAVAATPALTSTASAQQSAGVEVINGEYIVEVTDLPNNTLENKIINANGAVVHITARGDDFTIRNVGIQGPVAKGGYAGVIEPIVDSPSGSGIISNCYIDDVGDNCIFVNASHAGRLDITNTYFGKSAEDSIYASPPGNGSKFTQRGKDPGARGTVHVDKCCSVGAVDYAFRLGSAGSSVSNSTVIDAGTAIADLYGDGVSFSNIDVSGSGIGLKVGDHDEGNMRLLAASGRTTVTAVARNVRIDASEPTMENDIAGVNSVLKGQIASNPDSRIPAGVPTSAKAAGNGRSSASPSQSGRTQSSSGAGGVGIDTGKAHKVSAQSNDMIARSRADLDKVQPGMGVWIPPNATIQFDPANREGYQLPEGATLASEGATLEQASIAYPDEQYKPEQMIMASRGSSFIGLDIKGPIADVGSEPYSDGSFAGRSTVSMGIVLEDVGAVEISECDIHGWPTSGVQLRGNSTGTVHHSRIYDQYAADRGYGVAVGGSSRARVWYCYFDRCRHCVEAGDSGWYHVKGCSFGTDMVNHIIDMHPPGGGGFIVEQSTFHATNEAEAARETAMIRQVPNERSIIRNVWIKHTDKALAIRQARTRQCDKAGQTHCNMGEIANSAGGLDDFVNMDVSNIHWGTSQPPKGVGAPASIPAPDEVPRLGPNGGGTGPTIDPIGGISGAIAIVILLVVLFVVFVFGVLPLLTSFIFALMGSSGK